MTYRNIRANVPVYKNTAALPLKASSGQSASTEDGKFFVFNGTNWLEKGSGSGGTVSSVNGQTGVVVLNATDVGADPSGTAQNLFNALGDIYVRTTRFEIINSGTSGTITPPPNSIIVLDDFGGTVDAVVSKVSSSKPNFENAKTASNVVVATSFDNNGNWLFTGTPSSYPVAIIYRVRQKLSQFDSTATNIIGIPTTQSETVDLTWGAITGTLSNQTDLQSALDLKVNQINFDTHATRHLPNGPDALATGTPSTIGVANSTGTANAFARQDHIHDHGAQTDPTHHAVATSSTNGFMSSVDKNKLNDIENPRFRSYFFDDFLTGDTRSKAWTVSSSGSGAGLAQGTFGLGAPQNAVGIIRGSTGSTATGRTGLIRAVNTIELGYMTIEITWRFALEQPSTNLEQYVIYAGLIDSLSSSVATDGCYFAYSDSLGPNWLCVTRSNNVQTAIDSGIPYSSSQRRYTIVVNANATEVQFFIEDVLVATSNTNIPAGAARRTGIGIKIKKSIGTTASTFDVDYFEGIFNITGGR